MNVSYDWYKIFYYVALNGNITTASEQLFISQPAVSQSIKQLENSLGCILFIRNAKGVKLTDEGEVLYQYIAKGIEQIKLGEKLLASQLNLESGEINIGASDMTLEYYLLPYIEKFHRLYPKIKISITNGPTPETIRILKNDKIDFGIISEPVPDIKDFTVIPVHEIEDIFICGNEFAEITNNKISLEKLTSIPLILLEPNTSTRKYIDNYFNENNIIISPEFELATSSLIVQFTKRNLGIGCVVRDFAKEDLKNNLVYEIKLEKQIPKRHFCIIKKPSPISKASEKLLELLLS
ncbi:MAG: transcriptional regulator, LysR family [Clostridia bacterium]|nr:transcriptional regulator, LysR family [Clostridia bacterium]